MGKMFFDYSNGKYYQQVSDITAFDSDGNIYTSVSKNLVISSDGRTLTKVSDNYWLDSENGPVFVTKCGSSGFMTYGGCDTKKKK